MPAHAHTLPRLPLSYVWSYGVNSPRNFMPRHPWVLYSGPIAFLYQHVTVTDSACLHSNPNLPCSGLRDRPFDHAKKSTAGLVELLRQNVIGKVGVIQATFSFQSTFNPEARLWKNALGGGGILDVGCYPMSMARLIVARARGAEKCERRALRPRSVARARVALPRTTRPAPPPRTGKGNQL